MTNYISNCYWLPIEYIALHLLGNPTLFLRKISEAVASEIAVHHATVTCVRQRQHSRVQRPLKKNKKVKLMQVYWKKTG